MDTPVETNVVETESLADHEQAFAPANGLQRPERAPAPVEREDDGLEPVKTDSDRDEKGQFKPRQRAKSQQAGKDDVAQINAYTKRIREAEESLGIKVEKQEGESERVYQLRRRAELLEAKREAAKREAAPEPPPIPKEEKPATWDRKEPQYEDFADAPDQYQAHVRALAAYDRDKAEFDRQQSAAKDQNHKAIEERNRQRDAWFKEQESNHYERMKAYHEEHPEAQAILDKAGDVKLTPAVYSAIMTADNSPELLILVASNEELRDDLFILTDGKPLSKDLVDLVQRRLNRGRIAGTTGSAPVPVKPVPAVPRPPNPVRTGPMSSADTPPGDEDSLAAHEKFYGKARR